MVHFLRGSILILFLGCLSSIAEIIPSSNCIPWSLNIVGVDGGIPNRTTIYTNVSQFGSSAITNALALCPSGQVIYLPAGTYDITNRIDLKTGKTIRGAGISNTILLANTNFTMFYGATCGMSTNREILSGFDKGSSNITCSTINGVTIGGYIILSESNEVGLVYHRSAGYSNLSHVAIVTQTNGTDITFWPPLIWTFQTNLLPFYSYNTTTPISWAGIEDLTIRNGPSDTTADYINMSGVNLWVKNVETYNVNISGITIYTGCRIEIRQCISKDSHSVNEGYGVLVYGPCTGLLIEDNIFSGHYCDIVLEDTVGSVIGYNYCQSNYVSTWLHEYSNINVNHGPHSMMVLVEGNVAQGVLNDGYHGSGSHITMFRNNLHCNHPVYTDYRIAVHLYDYSYYQNVVGNVLGSWWITTNAYAAYDLTNSVPVGQVQCIYNLGLDNQLILPWDTNVILTLLRHGNYDFFNQATLWDPAIGDHVLPASYYLDSKPIWFSNAVWPTIGPDIPGMTNMIPAQYRYLGLDYSKSSMQILGKAKFLGKATIR